MIHRLKPAALFATGLPLTLMMCAAAPPQKGLEIKGGAGFTHHEYTTGGCGTPTYANKANDARLYTHVSYRSELGIGMSADANITATSVTESIQNNGENKGAKGPLDGKNFFLPSLVTRLSYHAAYGGIELGGGIVHNGMINKLDINQHDVNQLNVIPSLRAWAGKPDIIYAWTDFIAGPGSAGDTPLRLGLGHKRENYFITAGLGAGQNDATFLLEGQYRIAPKLWVGPRLHIGNSQNFGGMLMLGYAVGSK